MPIIFLIVDVTFYQTFALYMMVATSMSSCKIIHYSLSYLCSCIVTLNPEKGTKSSKAKGKVHNVNPKVLLFVDALKDLESKWKLP